LSIKHTSKGVAGQIFVPFVNYLLMLLTLLITYGFGTNGNITNAYGFTVCTMMIITTVFYSIAIHIHFGLSKAISVLFFLFFIIDAFFWGSVVFKVPQGGWVAILIAIVISFSMFVWMIGESYLNSYLKSHYAGTSISDLVEVLNNPIVSKKKKNSSMNINQPTYKLKIGSKTIPAVRVPGCGVFITDSLENVPKTFDMFIEKSRGVPQVIIFLKIVNRYSPNVPEEKRFNIEKHPCNVYTMSISIGFAEFDIPLLEIVERALEQNINDKVEITVYQASEVVRIVNKKPIKIILYVYSSFKEIFPSSISGVVIDPDHLVLIYFVCPI